MGQQSGMRTWESRNICVQPPNSPVSGDSCGGIEACTCISQDVWTPWEGVQAETRSRGTTCTVPSVNTWSEPLRTPDQGNTWCRCREETAACEKWGKGREHQGSRGGRRSLPRLLGAQLWHSVLPVLDVGLED